MELDEYKKLISSRLRRVYEISEDGTYLAEEYDIAAEKKSEETTAFGENIATKEIVLISFDCDADFIEDQIEKIPEIVLSGWRSISKNKSTILTRVFVMKNVPFSFVQRLRSWTFEKTEHRQFKSYAEAGIIIIDENNFTLFTSPAAAKNSQPFKVINNPVETVDD